MERSEFQRLYHDFARGRIDRRTFLQVSGLGMATAVLAACSSGGGGGDGGSGGGSGSGSGAWSPPEGVDLGSELNVTTWPNYHDPKTLEQFTELTGVTVNLEVYGSNEEMLAKLQAGSTGWDVLVPTNYTFETYGSLGLLEPLDLARIPNFDAGRYEARFLEPARYPAGSSDLYGISKNWGTTGYVVNTKNVSTPMTTWKDYFDMAQGELSGKVMIHDYQLTAIGNALKYFGYSFNSVDPAELAKAEELLLATKPHFFAISSDYQPPMRAGDAWVSMAWTGDAVQLNRDLPEITYTLGTEGGELWSDFFAVVKGAPHRDAAYAFLDFMAVPEIMAADAGFHGYPIVDQSAIELLPSDFTSNKIIYPEDGLLSALEFGAAVTLTDQNRADLWNRVKSA